MPTTYSSLAPGVYVEEVASGLVPIAGVGTSTAGFIGIVPDTINIPGKSKTGEVPKDSQLASASIETLIGKTLAQNVSFSQPSISIAAGPLTSKNASLIKDSNIQSILIEDSLDVSQANDDDLVGIVVNETITIDPAGSTFVLNPGDKIPNEITNIKDKIIAALGERKDLKIQVEQDVSNISESVLAGKILINAISVPVPDEEYKEGTIIDTELAEKLAKRIVVSAERYISPVADPNSNFETFMLKARAKEVRLCTNFSEFKREFGDFSLDKGQNQLAHAVYGFFRNGGTRCYVVRVTASDQVRDVLDNQFQAIDEIAIVAAPGITDQAQNVADHCKFMTDRFAILDSPEQADLSSSTLTADLTPYKSDYAAVYFPWIQVYDPATRENKVVPPSGHMAGIYARVDTQRGVHKAPANEPVLGAVGLAYNLSKAKQGPLNEDGINCIRSLNGSIRVWGARTLEPEGEFKYVSTRRLFNYLCESIDEGTQWTVFEPNSPELWAAIRRNVNAFLNTVWRSGALFGNTPEQAFYVKCDEETNPPDLRDQGQVVTEIGVAIVKPAEFVVFRLSQWSGNEG